MPQKKPLLPLLLFVALFAALFVFGFRMIDGAPPVERLSSLFVKAIPGKTIRLGYEELGQRPGHNFAERRHLALQFREDGWWIANISSGKKVLVEFPQKKFFGRWGNSQKEYALKRIPLRTGDKFFLNGNEVDVVSVSGEEIKLQHSTGTALWDGEKKKLILAGQQQFTVDSDEERIPAGERETACFYVGGSVSLTNQWALPGTTPRSLRILQRDGSFFLAPAKEHDVVLFRAGAERNADTVQTFQNQWLKLDGTEGMATRCIVGRTLYLIQQEKEGLRFTPLTKQVVFPQGEKNWFHTPELEQESLQLSWIGAGASFQQWLQQGWKISLIIMGILTISLIMVRLVVYKISRRRLPFTLNGLILLVPAVLMGHYGPQPSLALFALVCWLSFCWATLMIWIAGRIQGLGSRLWFCTLLLGAAGIFTLLQLFAGAGNTAWGVFIQRQITNLSFFALLVGTLSCCSSSLLKNISGSVARNRRSFGLHPFLQYTAMGTAFFLLGAHLVWGREGGLGWVQPSEVMKFLFPLLVALALQRAFLLWQSTSLNPRQKKSENLQLLVQIVVLILVVCGMFAYKSDFSPALILICYLLFCCWQMVALQVLSPPKGWFLAALLLLVVAVGAAGVNLYSNPTGQPWSSLPQHERFVVWSNPDIAPHSGAQVIESMELVGEGGWKGGTDSWLGANNRGNALPAVQDDFIGAFLLYRFGGVAGCGLVLVQLLYLYCLSSADRLLVKRNRGILVEREVSIFFSFLLRSMIFILALQWIISWGNCLGLLPVMGQPMTWLSSGNSHLWAVGFSGALLGLWVVWWQGGRSEAGEGRRETGKGKRL